MNAATKPTARNTTATVSPIALSDAQRSRKTRRDPHRLLVARLHLFRWMRMRCSAHSGSGLVSAQGGVMKASEVYLRAAELVDDPPVKAVRFSCCAIAEACGQFEKWNARGPCKFVDRFADNFLDGGYFGYSRDPEAQAHRVLALCLMSAIAESEE